MCDFDFDEVAEVWCETPRVARKEHQCDTCLRKIRVKEAYLDHRSIQAGYVYAESLCFRCWCIREEFGAKHKGTLFAPSYLVEALQECLASENEQYWEDDDRRWAFLLGEIRATPREVSA